MSRWDATTLVAIDETYDQDRASDGLSRLGAYLSKRADHHDQFREYDGSPRNSRRRCSSMHRNPDPGSVVGQS